jgi:hypothetical protein
MIIEDPDKKKELDKTPNMDEHGDPIYKIDDQDLPEITADDMPDNPLSDLTDENKFKDTLQDLKDETSQE